MGIYISLVSELQSLRRTSYVLRCLVASQKDAYKRLGIQRAETILHVGLYQPFLKYVKKIYSSVTKTMWNRALFLLPELILYSCWVLLYSCCLVFYSCCLVLCRVELVLVRVVTCYLVLCCVVLVLHRVISCCLVLACVVTRVVF